MRIARSASLAHKISAANLIGLAVLAAVLLALYQYALASYADRQSEQQLSAAVHVAWDVLKRQGDDFRLVDGKLVAGSVELNGRFDLVDHVQELVGGVATLFMGDVRVATNVKKADGSRAVGTALAPGPVHDALFKLGQSYRGKADILGRSYFTAYDPIRDKTGATIGVLFVGQLEADTHAQIADIQTWALSVALVIALAIGAAMLGLSRRMFAPLAHLRAAMRQISAGDLETSVQGVERGDDIGDMARTVEQLRRTALDRAALGRDNERQRAAAEAERRENERVLAQNSQEQKRVLADLAKALNRVAEGDLTIELGLGSAEGYQRLCDDFNSAVKGLKQTMSAVRRGAGAVAGAAGELASASQTLSQRADTDSASLEATARSLDRLTEIVGRSSDLAARARQAVSQAGEEATKGGEVARVASEAMRQIEASSQQISDILGLINEIAFQTNLLALNAGVEAARAGEAGKGFAVVAAEVRALAQRSGEASKQIAGLIASSGNVVAAGVGKVEETREALSRIIGKVADVNQMIGEIAASAGRQSSGLTELNNAVAGLGKSVQQNAAMAEETHAAGGALSNEADQLSHSIDQFRLDDAAQARLERDRRERRARAS